ncbi:hypothetical protein BCR33DRAFT_449390 [Rhizoclosmatium globosum]|uniref:FZ domain-containing protein n=1 Tax=Rhizoclosmatium globosum TaxID=329046 RepID=A0A1Y2BSR3_9FUNG|nr:hypothetical protein BCR33DRAFT_449390 [Rhizoclosmatium globosum]|eukprot:ORY37677.1 hypothetical protein BCR33DRAFT_449390 [Rhizoclosmatium globosum]
MLSIVFLATVAIRNVNADQCASYSGGYCNKVINYPVFLPTGASNSAIEGLLKAGGMDLLLTINSTNVAARPCVSAYLEWACYSSYPSCLNGVVKDVACKSVCSTAYTQCQSLFSMFGKTSSLPNCDGNAQGLNIPYGTSSTCLGYAAATSNGTDVIVSPPQPTGPTTCPSFLLPNPNYVAGKPPAASIPGQSCNGPCCVPCPQVHQLYDPTSIQSFNIFYQILVVLSFLGSVFLVSSYIVFPHKRAFPGAIMFYFSLGMLLLHINQMSIVGSDGYRTSCIDAITEAKQSNSPGCAIQSFVQTFSAMYLIYWIILFMFNLHLTVVWKTDWFSERMVLLNVIGVLYGLVPAIGILATGSSSTSGFNCMVDPQHVIGWVIIPMGVLGWPGVAVTIFTVIYLIRLLFSAPGGPNGKSSDHSGTKSGAFTSVAARTTATGSKPAFLERNGSANELDSNGPEGQTTSVKVAANRSASKLGERPQSIASGTGGMERNKSSNAIDTIPGQDRRKSKNNPLPSSAAEESVTKISKQLKAHKERVWSVLQKTWRSIALSVAIVIVFGSFWTFNLQIALTFINVSPSTPWLANWYACALQGNSRAVCAQQVAPHITPFVGVALSNITSGIGLIVFLIFGTGMLEDWKKLLFERVHRK